MKDGYYIKTHKVYTEKDARQRPAVEYISRERLRSGATVRQLESKGFEFQSVVVMTQRRLDELLLEAYICGVQDLPFDPVLLQSTEENK